ncbi:MAG: hypothetical protein ACI9G1_006011 [Pirellulaceae bacterium]|jgi:hypothetical protein
MQTVAGLARAQTVVSLGFEVPPEVWRHPALAAGDYTAQRTEGSYRPAIPVLKIRQGCFAPANAYVIEGGQVCCRRRVNTAALYLKGRRRDRVVPGR